MDQNFPAERLSERRLHIGGHLYVRSFERNEKTYWDCIRLRDKECTARAVTVTDHLNGIVVERGPIESPHRHAPNPDQVAAEKIKIGIKVRASDHRNRNLQPSAIVRGIFYSTQDSILQILICYNF